MKEFDPNKIKFDTFQSKKKINFEPKIENEIYKRINLRTN